MSHLRQSTRMKALYARRNKERTSINLVSMMDIFTILVFFLLVNSTEVEVLPNSKSLNLPESVAEQKPKQTIVIVVNDQDIVVQGRPIAKVMPELNSENEVVQALKNELDLQLKQQLAAHDPSLPT